MLRNLLITVLATACLMAPALAHAAPATTTDVTQYVDALGNKVLTIISNKALPKDKKQAQIEALFSQNVDIPWVSRFVMGRAWKQATDEQKSSYLREYERFLVQRYATRFTEYSSGSFKITGARDDGEGDFTVNMAIASQETGGEPVLIDYRIHKDGKNFKVFDIIIEGVSMITTQRSEFASVVNANGVDYLIAQLAKRASEPSPADIKSVK